MTIAACIRPAPDLLMLLLISVEELLMRCLVYTAIIFLLTLIQLMPWQSSQAQPTESIYPHRQSQLEYRVTNRRSISHILYEARDGRNYVTLITTHGGVWAFHASSHALHYACPSPRSCLQEMKKLDQFLKSGWNIGLHLRGSQIQRIEYHPAP